MENQLQPSGPTKLPGMLGGIKLITGAENADLTYLGKP